MMPAQPMAGALAGKAIVVTRPGARSASLAAAIEREGGTPLVFPALEILDIGDMQPVFALVDRLESFDLAVFISPNAVQKALDLVGARRASGWPERVRVAAIGRGSRRELEGRGLTDVIGPEPPFESEALLALPELAALAGRRVIIFRGVGGRELLGDALAARGATVEYAECYRRERARTDCTPLLDAWARGAVDAVTVSSGEGLAAFFEMIGERGRHRFRRTPLFVPHERVSHQAGALGAERVRVAGPGDADVVAALVAYFRDAK